MKKRLYASLMTYQVSDQEKEAAQKAIRWFDYCLKKLKNAEEHLNLVYNPFKKNSNSTPDEIFSKRVELRNYRDQVVENFNDFKRVSFKCYAILQPFTSDTQIEVLLKSFVLAIEDIEKQVNKFVDLFSNLKAENFVSSVIADIDSIKKEIKELEDIVEERIKTHIQSNILARNWVDSVSDELQEKVEKNSPMIMQLVEEREKMMKE